MRPCVVLVALLSLLTATCSTRAQVVLDQQNDLTGSGTADSTSGGFSELGQTFTVGVTGTLNRIEVQLNRFFGSGGNAILTVYNALNDLPTGAGLASRTLAWDSIPTAGFGYQVFDFSSMSIPLTAGSVMAYGLSSTVGGATGGLRSSFNQSSYAGGRALNRDVNPTGAWEDYAFPHDYGFKIFVDVSQAAGLPGDFNDDQSVDAADYVVWRKYFDSPSEAPLNGNGDGINGVDEGDYSLWQTNFADHAAESEPVPEPSSGLASLMLACIAAGFKQRNTLGGNGTHGRARAAFDRTAF